MASIITNFSDIVSDIKENKILLPDFQRQFVWTEEEQQRKIVASVLARMPIGSILLLKSKPDEFSSKSIGNKTEIDTSILADDTQFLLDGQQRMTVLTNVFSNAIYDDCKKISDIVSPSLKRRFFLRVPKWEKLQHEEDIFGVHKLDFPITRPDSEEPDFLSSNVLPFIEVRYFIKDDCLPYNPKSELSTKLDEFCISQEEGYLIPLYLIIPTDPSGKKKRDIITLRYQRILERISESIRDEIVHAYECRTTENDKNSFVDEIFFDDDEKNQIIDGTCSFAEKLEIRKQLWGRYLEKYLNSCIRNMLLNQIIVEESKRARAIDIYENLNRGGISLNTFDLVMARVATVSKTNFYIRIANNISKDKKYDTSVIPDKIQKLLNDKIKNEHYNASLNLKCYEQNKNIISTTYIDAFLNVFSLFYNNQTFDADIYKIDHMKRNKILEIDPHYINNNCEKVCESIDRAIFFFNSRCGIRSIKEINYSLMITLVATIFLKEKWYKNKQVHEKLEAWYWGAVFSGEYDKDQNVRMITNLQALVRDFSNNGNSDWLNKMKNNVLETKYFSDENVLLMEYSNEERYPKTVLRNFFCQYLLSQTYQDMFDNNKLVSVFSEDANELEAHHIIPLGSAKKVGDSTKNLRNKNKSIYNSPLNFVLITKDSNRDISDKSLNEYAQSITDEAKAKLHISNYDGFIDEFKTKDYLRNRYSMLKGDIKSHIAGLL